MTDIQKKLFEAACDAQKRAHAPYSSAFIGAAVLMADGSIYSGCNVENASFGGTVCAERVAIFKAVSEGAPKQVKEVLVVSDAEKPWPPCGFCRQVIAEFATEQTMIHTANLHGKMKSFAFPEIFPEAFTPKHLD
ncbi:cytidine deaminase [Bdellovibrio bacteriovorus]|uniref:Cytidine deaminase n=1 Tax=Bdellovibrio bacteriovorus TaxID=959 RepID=A0A162GBB7_BDEBC|nr:cytidine deaminase [Bdellovibrio bacteriovorus]KYG67717.1 cytidine deaminase [Bdellovibrio bacteriovorus]